MSEPPIYLDHNSTTPIDPRVVEAMTRAWRDCGANPASQHAPGRRARRMLEVAREGIAELLGAKTGGMHADRVIFTSGGTEANNLAIVGLCGEAQQRVLVSAIEHPSTKAAADELWRRRKKIRKERIVVAFAENESLSDDSHDIDAQLMIRAGEGDSEARVQLMIRYLKPLQTFFEQLVGDREQAGRMAADVFARALHERSDYKLELRFRNWLFSIAHDVAADAWRIGSGVHVLPVDSSGLVNIDWVEDFARGRLNRRPSYAKEGDPLQLVSVMLANNETGIIQPIEKLAALCRERGTTMHTDAVQAVGKIRVHFGELGVDAMTVAPHKFHGPLGIGALIVRQSVKLNPQLFGGFQQEGLRPGTENVALAVGFHAALEIAVKELPERGPRMRSLRDELERTSLAELPDTEIIGHNGPRLPNTSCISFPGVDRQALVMALDMAGVACSTGSACASGSSEPSPTLLAMGLPKEVIACAIRLSLGAFTTADEVAEATRRIINAVKHLRSRKSS